MTFKRTREPMFQMRVSLAPAPWTVEPYDNEHTALSRDLWVVRTGHGLVIGPISGKLNAHMVAAAPLMRDTIEHALTTLTMFPDAGLKLAQLLVELGDALREANGETS